MFRPQKIICTVLSLLLLGGVTAQTAALPASVDVSSIGAATYVIPVEVVPGTNGTEPSLAIAYNSQAGQGQMGLHWGLQGLSSVTRCTQTLHYDGDIKPLSFSAGDRFSLDGRRMVLLRGGRYHAPDAVYAFEVDDLSRIQRIAHVDGSFHFADTLSDGRIAEYGATSDSRLMAGGEALSWMVDKVTDADGNYITYHYGQSGGEIWIERIDYTFNPAASLTAAYASIVFEYLTSSLQRELYVASGTVRQSRLLKSVAVIYRDEQVRKYEFSYDESWHTARLVRIAMLDYEDTEVSATQVVWGDMPAMATAGSLPNVANGFALAAGNFNSDRVYDLIAVRGNEVRLYEKKRDGTYNITSNYVDWPYGTPDPTSLLAIDVDDDGIDELVYCNQRGQYLSARVSAQGALSVVSSPLYEGRLTGMGALWGDYDGDGRLEAVIPVAGADHVFCHGFEADVSHLVYDIDTGFRFAASGNFDGDGKSELATVKDSVCRIWSYSPYSGRWSLASTGTLPGRCLFCSSGDLNGDGTTDLVVLLDSSATLRWVAAIKEGTTSGWSCSHIPGLNTEVNVNPGNPIPLNPKLPVVLCDFNSDGRTDILQPAANGRATVCLSKGSLDGCYMYDTAGFLNPSPTSFFTNEEGYAKRRFTIGDIDGNGTPDIVLFNSSQGGVYPCSILFYSGSVAGSHVERVTDAMGKTVRFEYSTLSLMQERFTGQSMRWMQMPVVRNLLVSNGLNGFDTTAFFYGNAQFDRYRRLFIGFGRFGRKNGGVFTEQAFSRVPCEGLQRYHETLAADSTLVWWTVSNPYSTPALYSDGTAVWHSDGDILAEKRQHRQRSLTRPSAAGTTLYMPYSERLTVTSCIANNVTETLTELDAGNWRVASQTTTYRNRIGPDAVQKEESASFRYTVTQLDNGAALPQVARAVTRRREGLSPGLYLERTVDRDFSHGRVASETATDNGGFSTTTTYTYTPAGTPLRVTQTPSGEASRFVEYTYDATYRFAETTTDHSQNSESAVFDGATGNVLQYTDVNGLATTYEYDACGRCIRTAFPDGTVRETSYTAGTGGFMHVKLVAATTESGRPLTKVYYDALGRERHRYVSGEGYSDIVYNPRGQVARRTVMPYASIQDADGGKCWQTYAYDIGGRCIQDSSLYRKNTYSYHPEAYTPAEYLYSESVTDKLGATSTRYYDAAGRVAKVVDGGGAIVYRHGLTVWNQNVCELTEVISGSDTNTAVADSRGNRMLLHDPDAGSVASTYNGWNELTSQTDANGNTTQMAYDNQGRIVIKTYTTPADETDSYSYTYNSTYTASSRGKVRLASVAHNGSPYKSFVYDHCGRLSSQSKNIGGNTYTHQYTYDPAGRLQIRTWPDGFAIRYDYDSDGRLRQIENAATGELIYGVGSRTSAGQPALCWFGNGTGAGYTHNSHGLPTQIKYGDKVLNDPLLPPTPDRSDSTRTDPGASMYTVDDRYSVLNYTYNQNGYITQKGDSKTGQHEDYEYDELGRLTQYTAGGSATYNFGYDGGGNMTRNTKVSPSHYSYDAHHPHAVSGIDAYPGVVPPAKCDLTYNSRNRPASISQDGWQLQLDYDDGLQREREVLTHGGAAVCTTNVVSGDCEHEIRPGGSRHLDYIRAGGSTVAVHVKNGATDSIYYVQTDLLGSWEKIVDNNRNVVQSSHFDPWGNRMSAADWTLSQDGSTFAFHRGFTGHMHYDRFGIINMNARLYDPVTARFFSPDPQVQKPFSTQGLNRYTYCGNNPVMYIDEDGEIAWLIPSLINTVIGIYSGGVIANNGEYNPLKWDYSSGRTWGYMGAGGAVGFASGLLGWAISTAQIPMANTISLMASSFINSTGTSLYTEGLTPVSISFGFGSYDITNDVFHTFSKDNPWYVNLGYGLGSMANLSDIMIGFNPQKVDLVTEHSDEIGHSSIVEHGSNTGVGRADPNGIISIGPDKTDPRSLHWGRGVNDWSTHTGDGTPIWRQTLNANKGTIENYAKWLNNLQDKGHLIYSLELSSCVTHTSMALNLSGIFNIGIHHIY